MVMAALATVLDPKDCHSFIHVLQLLLYLTLHPKGYMTPLFKFLTEQYGAAPTPTARVRFSSKRPLIDCDLRWLHLLVEAPFCIVLATE